jgi:hypothetical protein
VSWEQRFYDPIILPVRKPLVTLRDAALYITKLPKAEHDADEWQAAMVALLLVAEHDGPTMFARIGVMRALQRHQPKNGPAPHRKNRQNLQTRPMTKVASVIPPLLDAFKSPLRLGCLTCNVGRSS